MPNSKLAWVGFSFLFVFGLVAAGAGVPPRGQAFEANIVAQAQAADAQNASRAVGLSTSAPTSAWTAATPSPITDTLAARIDEYMHIYGAGFSGTILVARQGQVLFSRAYGFANREHDVPNTLQTKFAIASLTKAFSAMAVMMLQEQGQLQVQDSICKYISDCPPTWKPITLHHLLTHTSGIPNYTDVVRGQLDKFDMGREYMPAEGIALFKDLPLDFEPGSQWKYSNSGYFLLGAVIEQVSGESYDTFIQKRILQPLGMTESGYDRASIIVKNRASGYSINPGIQLVNVRGWDVSQRYAAGGLYSTVGDLLKWDQALYTDRLVSSETLRAIFTSAATAPGGIGYGYGWMIYSQSGHRVIEHGGSLPGFRSNLARYPDDQVTIIILSNLDVLAPAPISAGLARIVFEGE